MCWRAQVGTLISLSFRPLLFQLSFSCPQSLYGLFKSYVCTGIGIIICVLDSKDLRWSDTCQAHIGDVACQLFAKVSLQ